MGGRQVLQLPGVSHSAPIPLGVRIGDHIWTSALMGMDPATETIPDSPEEQARLVFENLEALLKVGGAGRGDIAHVTVFLSSNEHRVLLNDQWLAWYPDPLDRPARHVIVGPLPQNAVIQLEVVAAITSGGG